MQNSQITIGSGGTTFAGPDAVALFRARTIQKALELYVKSEGRMLASRAYTPSNMLEAATSITGLKYKRGQHKQAAEDIGKWADTMQCALPVEKS